MLTHPKDPDGGGRRDAAIAACRRKIEMAQRDVDVARVAKYEAQMKDLLDEDKPVR